MLLRKRGEAITPEQLSAPQPGEIREALALRENVRQLGAELDHAWQEWAKATTVS